MSTTPNTLMTDQIGETLPYLRRYARALTGSQANGDALAADTLEAVLKDPSLYDTTKGPKTALFSVFHSIWRESGDSVNEEEGPAAWAQHHLAKLTRHSREALLLNTIEEMNFEDIAEILDVTAEEANSLVDTALKEMSRSISGKIMIIEDEALIATDLEGIAHEMGHHVTGVARTESAAIKLFEAEHPDLILSDIQLADGSSGIDAVNRIVANQPDIPVIFITAFPEKLLTGEGPEPAFLIAKPYLETQVRSAISQAMFFASTDTLKA